MAKATSDMELLMQAAAALKSNGTNPELLVALNTRIEADKITATKVHVLKVEELSIGLKAKVSLVLREGTTDLSKFKTDALLYLQMLQDAIHNVPTNGTLPKPQTKKPAEATTPPRTFVVNLVPTTKPSAEVASAPEA